MEKKSYIIVIFWVLIVIGIIISNEAIFLLGKEVLLKIYPIDPRDFLRGDYVSLDYEIGKISDKESASSYRREKAYVVLDVDNNNVAHKKEILFRKPSGALFIQGEFYYKKLTFPQIQKYFTKEGKGKELERKLQKGGYAKVLIDKRGHARIKEII